MTPEELKAGAQKELIRRAARAELARRASMQTVNSSDKTDRQRSFGENITDIGKSLASGIAEGGASLAGMPADLGRLAGRGVTYGIGRLMGQSPEDIAQQQNRAEQHFQSPIQAPNTQQVQGAMESVTGPMHVPETTAGQYANTIGQMAPAAFAGPGSIARKLAMTAVPGAISEGAGQATQGTAAEPYARFAGALAGGIATAGRGGAAMKQMRNEAPAVGAVKAATDSAYSKLRAAGIQFDPTEYNAMVGRITSKLHAHGWRPRDGDPISSDIKELVGQAGKPVDFAEMENLRQYVGNLPNTASNADKARAGIIRDELDQFFENGSAISTSGKIPPQMVGPMVKQARELARRNIIAKQITEMSRKGDHYVAGGESGNRNQFASYLRNPKNKLSPTETQAFDKVVKREGLDNIISTTGGRMNQALAPGAGGATGGLIGALVGGGPVGAAVGAGIGSASSYAAHLIARKFSEAKTMKAVDEAMKTVLAGKNAQAKAKALDDLWRRQSKLRAAIAAENARKSSKGKGPLEINLYNTPTGLAPKPGQTIP